MKVWQIAAIGIVAGAAVLTFSAASYGAKTEVWLEAQLESNENIYAQGTQKVMEVAQVPSMYVADLEKIVRASIQGRYGPNGSQATMQWLNEQNIAPDPSMHKRIQVVIEEFRNKFEGAQQQQIAKVAAYKAELAGPWSGIWLRLAGYPKIDLSKYKIVTTDKARQTFETKRDSGIQLRPAQ